MLRRIRLLCGMSGPTCGPAGHWLPGRALEVPADIDAETAARLIAAGHAAPVAVDREQPAAVSPLPEIETAVVSAPEQAVVPRGRRGNKR